jgi:NitT/TauT family transport system substrate-binding protein
MKHKSWKIVTIVILLAILLSACGPSNQETKRKIKVSWNVWEGDYTVLIAKDKGFFAKHGLDVEPVYYNQLSDIVPDMVGGKLDIGLVTLDYMILAASMGSIKCVGIEDSGGTAAVVSSQEINSPANLKGKRLGLNVGTNEELYIRNMLQRFGLSTRDVTLVNTAYEEVTGKIPTEFDAGFTWEPYIRDAKNKGLKVLFSDPDLSALYTNVIIASSSWVKDSPDEVRAFLAAWYEAVDFRKSNPDESLEIIKKYTQLSDEELALGDVQIYDLQGARDMLSNPKGTDASSVYYLAQQNMTFLISKGSLTYSLKLDEVIDPTFLP